MSVEVALKLYNYLINLLKVKETSGSEVEASHVPAIKWDDIHRHISCPPRCEQRIEKQCYIANGSKL